MPGMSRVLDSPLLMGKATAALAAGATQGEVGRMVGLSRQTVNKWASKDEIKAEIEAQAQALMALVPTAVDNARKTLDVGTKALDRELADNGERDEDTYKPIEARRANDVKLIGLARETGQTVLQTVGIAPTHCPSLVIGNLVLGDQNVLSPVLTRLLCGPEIDVTPEGEDEE